VQLLQLSNRRQQCVGRGKLLTIKVPEHTQLEKMQLSEEEQWSVVSLQKRRTKLRKNAAQQGQLTGP
jgi:hypothetical protein